MITIYLVNKPSGSRCVQSQVGVCICVGDSRAGEHVVGCRTSGAGYLSEHAWR